MRDMFSVSGEQFIAAYSRQQDSRLFARLAADKIRGDDRWVGGRLVHVPGQLWQKVNDIRFDDDLVMLTAETTGETLRNCGIVNRALADPILFWKSEGRREISRQRLLSNASFRKREAQAFPPAPSGAM